MSFIMLLLRFDRALHFNMYYIKIDVLYYVFYGYLNVVYL